MNKVNILHFRDVTFAHLFKHVSVPVIIEPIIVKQYLDIPATFGGVATWPKWTNLKCWNCCQLFNCYPKFVPHGVFDGPEIPIQGNFCSWCCASRFIEDHIPPDRRCEFHYFLVKAEEAFSGTAKQKIVPAKPRWMINEFCGCDGLSHEKFNKDIEETSQFSQLTLYKLEHFDGSRE